MRRPRRILLAVLLAVVVSAPAAAGLGEEQVLERAERFGRALEQGDPALLRDLLSDRGRVRVRLELLGPEDGSFGSGQALALFSEILSRTTVRDFEITWVDCDPGRLAMVRATVRLGEDPVQASPAGLQLTFRPGDDVWVLQEIRETSP